MNKFFQQTVVKLTTFTYLLYQREFQKKKILLLNHEKMV